MFLGGLGHEVQAQVGPVAGVVQEARSPCRQPEHERATQAPVGDQQRSLLGGRRSLAGHQATHHARKADARESLETRIAHHEGEQGGDGGHDGVPQRRGARIPGGSGSRGQEQVVCLPSPVLGVDDEALSVPGASLDALAEMEGGPGPLRSLQEAVHDGARVVRRGKDPAVILGDQGNPARLEPLHGVARAELPEDPAQRAMSAGIVLRQAPCVEAGVGEVAAAAAGQGHLGQGVGGGLKKVDLQGGSQFSCANGCEAACGSGSGDHEPAGGGGGESRHARAFPVGGAEASPVPSVFTNKVNAFDVRIDRERCVDCGKCARLCPTFSMSEGSVKRGGPEMTCMKCGKCVDGCPKGAISFHVKGTLSPSSGETSRILFLYPAFLFLAAMSGGNMTDVVVRIVKLIGTGSMI